MKKEHLRPIGSEFWMEFPVSSMDSASAQNRFLYRVTAHDEVDHPKGWAERLDVIAMQSRQISGIVAVKLSDRFVHDYTFDPWGEIEWKEGETPHEVPDALEGRKE